MEKYRPELPPTAFSPRLSENLAGGIQVIDFTRIMPPSRYRPRKCPAGAIHFLAKSMTYFARLHPRPKDGVPPWGGTYRRTLKLC